MGDYLIVDDNEAFADNLAEILQDAGHRAAVVRGGAEALEKVRAHRYDALLTDMRMPRMSGAQLIHEIRSVDPGLPAILVTAYSNTEDLTTARQEGLLAVLAKPLHIPKLLELLVRARRDGLVVMIEDDHALADNITEALREHGFTAVLATSVLETDKLASLRPFAALVDLRVPGGPDGEAMRRLSARFPGLPMLVTTGHPISPPIPARRIFHKPYPTPELIAELEATYGESRPSQ